MTKFYHSLVISIEIITYDHSMDHSDLIVCSVMENFIFIKESRKVPYLMKRVKAGKHSPHLENNKGR